MKLDAFFQKTARLCIVLATLIWGSAFVVMKNTIAGFPVFYLLAIRFLAAALLLGLLLLPKWKQINRDYVFRGMGMGAFLFLAYATQTFGLMETSPSVNAFLTTIYCVLVPFLNWLVARKRPDRFHLLAAVLSVAGVGLISLNGGAAIGLGRGTLLTLVSGFFFACHIVLLDRSARAHDVFLLTAIQFATAGGLALVCALLRESFPANWDGTTWFSLVYLTLLCTVATLLLQALGQKYTNPAAASVLLSLESVFAVIFSMLFYGDRPSVRLFCGFGLIFFAVLCSETKLRFFKRTKTSAAAPALAAPDGTEEPPAPLK